VPDSAAVCGELLAESLTESVAVLAPDVVGLKATVMVQLAPAPRLFPQLLKEIRKSDALVPVMFTPDMVMEAFVPFFSVADCPLLC
jgi:hypothetical protein